MLLIRNDLTHLYHYGTRSLICLGSTKALTKVPRPFNVQKILRISTLTQRCKKIDLPSQRYLSLLNKKEGDRSASEAPF